MQPGHRQSYPGTSTRNMLLREKCQWHMRSGKKEDAATQGPDMPRPTLTGPETDGAMTWRKLAQNRQDFASKLPDASYSFPSASPYPLL